MHSLYTALRRLREERGWTQQYLAAHLHISTPAYSKIECGLTDVNYSRISQIAACYGLSVIELFAYGMPKTKPLLKIEMNALLQQLNEREKEVSYLKEKLKKLGEELDHINSKN